jgi:hypothetical protein
MSNRTKTHLFWTLALAGLGVTAAPAGCGGSNTGYGAFANADGGGNTFDATNSGSSSGNSSNGGSSNGSSGDDGSQTCAQSCSSDQDCQNSCPPVPNGGVNCCDLTSSTCFSPSGVSICPVAEAGGPSE